MKIRDVALLMGKEEFVETYGTITHIWRGDMPEFMKREHTPQDYYPMLVVERSYTSIHIYYHNVALYGDVEDSKLWVNHVGTFNYDNSYSTRRAVWTVISYIMDTFKDIDPGGMTKDGASIYWTIINRRLRCI